MADAGTWEIRKYGPHFRHQLSHETSVGGSDLPWIMYFPGGGWARHAPEAFYDDTVGENVWRDGLWAGRATYPVRGFVCMGAVRFYDWSNGGGSSDQDSYRRDSQGRKVFPTTSGFVGQQILDAQRCVQFVKDHASDFGINPRKGIVMGNSAGTPPAAGVAYSPSRPYYGRGHPANASPYLAYSSSRVAAAHLRWSPADWRDYLDSNTHSKSHFGVESQAHWDAVPDLAKGGTSPVELILAHRMAIPTWGQFNDALSPTAAQDPPFQTPSQAWTSDTAYVVGDRRTNSGDSYYCHAAHTDTGGNREPGVAAGWESYWEEFNPSPYHHPINGEILRDRAFANAGVQYVFEHPGSGHTYPDDVVAWMKLEWDRQP